MRSWYDGTVMERRVRVEELLRCAAAGEAVEVRGWIKSARHAKGLSFLDISDGSSARGIQVIASPELPNFADEVRGLRTGSAVIAAGEVVPSPGRGQSFEIRATRIRCLGGVGDDYPLQKKRHSLEFLRSVAHLRLRTDTLGAVMRVRSAAAAALRRFFAEADFIEFHTPIITVSDCEGAGSLFRVSGGGGDAAESGDFFGRPAYLTVSGQLQAEIGALALSRVYTFGPTFRAENSNTSRHLAEFWMVEAEAAFCELDDDAAIAEALIRSVCRELLDRCAEELGELAARNEVALPETLEHVAERDFEHLTYGEAVERLARATQPFAFAPTWGADLQAEHERYLCETIGRPVVVTDYPRAIKPFYMYLNDDERTVRAMDILLPRVGELVGGSQREHRLDVLEARLAEANLDATDYWWYLDLRRHGGAPHAGFGLGFERLLQFATGMANIRDVIPFPRTPGSAAF